MVRFGDSQVLIEISTGGRDAEEYWRSLYDSLLEVVAYAALAEGSGGAVFEVTGLLRQLLPGGQDNV